MASIQSFGVSGGQNSMSIRGNHLFRKRFGPIDWRRIASVDVDKIAQELDFQALQDSIMSVAFCNVETEFFGLDSNFIKLFRIGQLIIEYLLHSQQYLSKQSSSLEQQCHQINKEQVILKEEIDKLLEEKTVSEKNLKLVMKENRKRRKEIEAYQDMMNAGATGLHPCPVCKREFISKEYVKSHINRRHPEVTINPELTKRSQDDLEARLLQQMIERLQASEKQMREEMKQKETDTRIIQEAEKEQWKEAEKKKLMTVFQEKFEDWTVEETKTIQAAQLVEFEEWKVEERKKLLAEHEEIRKPILSELDQIRAENLILKKEKLDMEIMLQKKEEEISSFAKRQSHIGHLEGAKEIILQTVEAAKDQAGTSTDIHTLKESMEQEVNKLRTLVKKRDTYWKARLKELHDAHQQSLSVASSTKPPTLESSKEETDFVHSEMESLKRKQKKQEELLKVQQDELILLQKNDPPLAKNKMQQDAEDYCDKSDGVSGTHEAPKFEHAGSIFMGGESEDLMKFESLLKFSPIADQPQIKTIYQHSSPDMEKIRKQTRALFEDALEERNIEKNRLGLKAVDLEAKMALLVQERKEKHSYYDEHRQRICEKLAQYSSKDIKTTVAGDTQPKERVSEIVVRKLPKPSQVPHQQQDNSNLVLGSQSGNMFDNSMDSNGSTETSLSYQIDDHKSSPVLPAIPKKEVAESSPVTDLVESSPDSTNEELNEFSMKPQSIGQEGLVSRRDSLESSCTEDENIEQLEKQLQELTSGNFQRVKSEEKILASRRPKTEGFFDAITGHQQPSFISKLQGVEIGIGTAKHKNNNVVKAQGKIQKKDNNPWISGDDISAKDSITTTPRITSSTPIKGKSGYGIKDVSASNIGAPPNDISLDSFDISSSNDPVSTFPQKSALTSTDKLALHSKQATSQSALTNVSLDDFDLSDLSDIM